MLVAGWVVEAVLVLASLGCEEDAGGEWDTHMATPTRPTTSWGTELGFDCTGHRYCI